MHIKPIRLTAYALLSLLLVFGVTVLRHSDRTLPFNPIAAAETITAAENNREESTTAPPRAETTASAQDEPTTRENSVTGKRSVSSRKAEKMTAFSRGSAAATGSNEANGVRQSQSDDRNAEVDAAEEEIGASATGAALTAAAAESTTAPLGGAPQKDQPTTRPPATETTEPANNPSEREPVIVTDLRDCLKKQSELTEGNFGFYAYLDGDTDGCSLRVRLTRADGSRTLLQPTGVNYHTPLTLGVNAFTLTILQNGEAVSYREFTVEVVADKASQDNPSVGSEPPIIQTNLDGWTDEIVNSRFSLRVTARMAQGAPIYADGVEVRLDGNLICDPTGGNTLEYTLFFEAPNVGETERHAVTVLAWDANGNSAFKSYEIVYRHTSNGDRIGEITVILDATTVGLGVLDMATVSLRQGENAAQLLLRVLDEFNYTYDYAGSDRGGFYLRRIARDGMCDGAQIPDRLWTMILRDGLKTTPQHDRDSLGEHDYTQGSGWMYSVNNALFPGKGMELTFLNPGDTLRVCFTLSYGKDVGGFDSSGGGMGSLSGYCGIWRDGEYLPLEHQWSQPDEHGDAVCEVCHEQRRGGEDE